jgi:hypothetical protein
MADMSVHHPTAHAGHKIHAMTLESVSEATTYWLALFGVYLTVGYLMWTSAAEKLFVGHIAMPATLAKTFAPTWIAKLVGVNFLWGFLGVLELAIMLVVLASVVRGEFLPSRQKLLLQVSLALSLALFAILAFGEMITANFAGVLSQYTYFGVTILIMGLVSMMPPSRSAHWLTRGVSGSDEDVASSE